MEIQEIKQSLSIKIVLEHYNLHPDRHAIVRCPFHADEMASMKIYSVRAHLWCVCFFYRRL